MNTQELSSKPELLGYYNRAVYKMKEEGVTFLFNCQYDWDHPGRVVSVTNPTVTYQVGFKTLVNGTYWAPSIPQTSLPKFKVQFQNFVSPSELSRLQGDFRSFVVIGAGKTGIDTVKWLLDRFNDPSSITWIMPRDAWWIVRDMMGGALMFDLLEIFCKSDKPEACFLAGEQRGAFHRISTTTKPPTMFHGAVVSRLEAEQVRRVKHIIRGTRVTEITENRITFDNGQTHDVDSKTVCINCSENGLKQRPVVPIFAAGLITLQPTLFLHVTASVAQTAFVEAMDITIATKNQYCIPNTYPDTIHDLYFCWRQTVANLVGSSADLRLFHFMTTSPLVAFNYGPTLFKLYKSLNGIGTAKQWLEKQQRGSLDDDPFHIKQTK